MKKGYLMILKGSIYQWESLFGTRGKVRDGFRLGGNYIWWMCWLRWWAGQVNKTNVNWVTAQLSMIYWADSHLWVMLYHVFCILKCLSVL